MLSLEETVSHLRVARVVRLSVLQAGVQRILIPSTAYGKRAHRPFGQTYAIYQGLQVLPAPQVRLIIKSMILANFVNSKWEGANQRLRCQHTDTDEFDDDGED
jgi:hypothetical protein